MLLHTCWLMLSAAIAVSSLSSRTTQTLRSQCGSLTRNSVFLVGIFNPHTADTAARRARVTGKPLQRARPSVELKRMARFYREITSEGRECHMARSQFPNELIDANGHRITKPTA